MTRFLLIVLTLIPLPVMAARRIVSLSPALTELVAHLGGQPALIGRSSACDQPPEVRRLPVMGDFARPDLERIVAARADLVITNDLVNPGVAAALRKHGISLVTLPCRNAAEYQDAVRFIAGTLGKPADPELQRCRDALTRFQKMPPLPLKVLVVVWATPVIAAGHGTFPAEMAKLAGAALPAGGTGCFKPSQEWLMQTKIDLVIVTDSKILPQLRKNACFQKKRMIALKDGDLLSRPGPRWTDGAALLRQELEKTAL